MTLYHLKLVEFERRLKELFDMVDGRRIEDRYGRA